VSDFDAIQAGDLVALYYGFRGEPIPRAVVRVTPKQIVLASNGNGSDWRFWRESGREIGGRWDGSRIGPLTEEVKTQVKRNAALEALSRQQWHSLPTETLFAVLAVLQQHRAQPETADAVVPGAGDTRG